MRLFIAILFSDEVKNALLKAAAQLKSKTLTGNFTKPQNLHLTMAFLGEVQSLERPIHALQELDFQPFPLQLGRSGRFGDLYWAGLRESAALSQLSQAIRASLDRAGVLYDKKAFRPHITLARNVKSAVPVTFCVPAAAMTVQKLSLMQSERTAGGLRYISVFEKRAAKI